MGGPIFQATTCRAAASIRAIVRRAPSGLPRQHSAGRPAAACHTGNVVIMVRDQAGVWHYASLPAGQVPPPVQIDNTLPGGPPPVAGQPLPPTAAPKK